MKESKFSNGYMCGVVVRQRDGMLTLPFACMIDVFIVKRRLLTCG